MELPNEQCKILKKEFGHKLDPDTELKMAVGIGHPCIAWLVENVADNINKFKIGHDGRTSF